LRPAEARRRRSAARAASGPVPAQSAAPAGPRMQPPRRPRLPEEERGVWRVSSSWMRQIIYCISRDQPHPGFASWFVPGSRAQPGQAWCTACDGSIDPADTPHASQPYTNGPLHNIFASLHTQICPEFSDKSAPESTAAAPRTSRFGPRQRPWVGLTDQDRKLDPCTERERVGNMFSGRPSAFGD